MQKQIISLDHLMDEILNRWPITITLFLEYRMACVGCSLSAFDTLGDALEAYNLPPDIVLKALNTRVAGDLPQGGNH